MFVLNTAFAGIFPLRVKGEKTTMIFLEVSVTVPAGSEHFFDIKIEPCFFTVAAGFSDLIVEKFSQFEVGCVFPSSEILVIVNVALSPERSLIVEDIALCIVGRVF